MEPQFTIKDATNLVISLKKENNPNNNKLIAFYEAKIQRLSIEALKKIID